MTTAPVIETARLRLRPHRMEDFHAYRDAFASDRLRYMGAPVDERRAWANYCRDIAQWPLLGHGAWAVDTRDGGFVGQVSLNRHPYFPEPELGWMLMPEGEGKGFAREAAIAARDWAFNTGGFGTLVSYIHRDNSRSIALAERLGATADPAAPACPYDDHLVYRHPIPEVRA